MSVSNVTGCLLSHRVSVMPVSLMSQFAYILLCAYNVSVFQLIHESSDVKWCHMVALMSHGAYNVMVSPAS